MPCIPFTTRDGIAGIICVPSRYRQTRRAPCPHCCVGNARTIHAWREVHSGYCAPDMVCGRCGQYWTFDHDRLPKMSQQERAENIEIVRALKRAPAPGPEEGEK